MHPKNRLWFQINHSETHSAFTFVYMIDCPNNRNTILMNDYYNSPADRAQSDVESRMLITAVSLRSKVYKATLSFRAIRRVK